MYINSIVKYYESREIVIRVRIIYLFLYYIQDSQFFLQGIVANQSQRNIYGI